MNLHRCRRMPAEDGLEVSSAYLGAEVGFHQQGPPRRQLRLGHDVEQIVGRDSKLLRGEPIGAPEPLVQRLLEHVLAEEREMQICCQSSRERALACRWGAGDDQQQGSRFGHSMMPRSCKWATSASGLPR